MLPPLLGALLLLVTVMTVVLGTAVGLWAWVTRRAPLARGAAMAGGGAVAVYAVFWLLGLALAPSAQLKPGEQVSFCGLDCHLHVSVAGVRLGRDLGATVAFSSNAMAAPEHPAELRFRLRDEGGREYGPMNSVPDTPLAAGESRLFELHFPAGISPAAASLIVTWRPGLDYLVPGSGNPLVQARKRLSLPAATGTGA